LERLRSLKIPGTVRLMFEDLNFTVGFAIFAAIVLTSLIGGFLRPFDPFARAKLNSPPSWDHPFGVDGFGRDVLSQLFVGIELSLTIGFSVAILSSLIGLSIGLLAGYYGGIVDSALMIIADTIIVLPMLPILVLVASSVRMITIPIIILLLSVFNWAWFSRNIRSLCLSLKQRAYVDMARLSGMSETRIVFTEIMPHVLPWTFARFVNAAFWAILAESGLAILGVGAQTEMTLGMMIRWIIFRGAMMRGVWWWWLPPIAVLSLLFIVLFLMQVGLDKVLNPKLRERG
jgi:peptide/nickel transport system permease protein